MCHCLEYCLCQFEQHSKRIYTHFWSYRSLNVVKTFTFRCLRFFFSKKMLCAIKTGHWAFSKIRLSGFIFRICKITTSLLTFNYSMNMDTDTVVLWCPGSLIFFHHLWNKHLKKMWDLSSFSIHLSTKRDVHQFGMVFEMENSHYLPYKERKRQKHVIRIFK